MSVPARLATLLLGRRLANREARLERIGALTGVAAMGLDGLGSAAYGPEAALSMLAPAGAAGLGAIVPIMAVILALLAILSLSYRQTIAAYPTGGGAYTVAKENLGANAGLLAAAALMIDYVLNVAVGISAGVGALVSAVPALHPHILPLCLAVLVAVTLVNLRGTVESGVTFLAPTYLFIASFAGILLWGLAQAALAGGHPVPVEPPPAVPPATAGLSLWLVLRAFAAGCTAMTGVEAVSNGVPAFRDPPERMARRCLTIIVAVLGFLLAAVALLVPAYHIAAMDQGQPGYRSVLAQVAAAAIGRGPLFYMAIGSVLAILTLSANTSFVDFPRMCRRVAEDGYLPRAFAIPGRRLVYAAGILFLAAASGLLLIVFGGITDRLIPLFAVGAFLAFTLSQAGMAAHWRRQRHRLHFAINGLGAVATACALSVILVAKFIDGAWITVLVAPVVILLLRGAHRHYAWLARTLAATGPIAGAGLEPPVVIVPIEGWTSLVARALAFALRLSPDVIGLHLANLDDPERDAQEAHLRTAWKRDVVRPLRASGRSAPRLVIRRSPYRQLQTPILDHVRALEAAHPGRPIAVLIPELVKCHWWQHLLHLHRARRLRAALLAEGNPSLVVMSMPWALDQPVSWAVPQPTRQEQGTNP